MDSKLKTTALMLLIVSVITVMAASVTPELIEDWSNQWEQRYAAGFDCSFKFEGPQGSDIPEGTHTAGPLCCGNTITITVYGTYDEQGKWEPKSFDWTSTYPISAVIVKTGAIEPGKGDVAYLYVYAPPMTSDTNLVAPGGKGISHITFCWDCPSERVPEFPLAPEAIAALGLIAWTAVRRRRKL